MRKVMGPLGAVALIALAVAQVPILNAASSTASDSNIGSGRDYYNNILNECKSIPGLDEPYCACIIRTSRAIPENDPILDLYIAEARGKDEGKALYENIISGKVYDNHNFSSERAKRDFVEGQGRVFVHRVETQCDNIK